MEERLRPAEECAGDKRRLRASGFCGRLATRESIFCSVLVFHISSIASHQNAKCSLTSGVGLFASTVFLITGEESIDARQRNSLTAQQYEPLHDERPSRKARRLLSLYTVASSEEYTANTIITEGTTSSVATVASSASEYTANSHYHLLVPSYGS